MDDLTLTFSQQDNFVGVDHGWGRARSVSTFRFISWAISQIGTEFFKLSGYILKDTNNLPQLPLMKRFWSNILSDYAVWFKSEN